MAAGAIGSVSGMAAAVTEVVRGAVDDPSPAAGERLAALRSALEGCGQFIAAAKHVLGMRGVAVRPVVRPPLRPLTAVEAAALETRIGPLLPAAARA